MGFLQDEIGDNEVTSVHKSNCDFCKIIGGTS